MPIDTIPKLLKELRAIGFTVKRDFNWYNETWLLKDKITREVKPQVVTHLVPSVVLSDGRVFLLKREKQRYKYTTKAVAYNVNFDALIERILERIKYYNDRDNNDIDKFITDVVDFDIDGVIEEAYEHGVEQKENEIQELKEEIQNIINNY